VFSPGQPAVLGCTPANRPRFYIWLSQPRPIQPLGDCRSLRSAGGDIDAPIREQAVTVEPAQHRIAERGFDEGPVVLKDIASSQMPVAATRVLSGSRWCCSFAPVIWSHPRLGAVNPTVTSCVPRPSFKVNRQRSA